MNTLTSLLWRRSRISALAACLAGSALPGVSQAAGVSFGLPASGCPMAHCDSAMSDAVNAVLPTSISQVRVDRNAPGAKTGLGCVSNTRLVACTGSGDPTVQSNLIVYDADGNRIWTDGGILGDKAWTSAAMINADGHVIAADPAWLLRADPTTGTILWKSAKPDNGTPISPVLVGSSTDMVLMATSSPSVGVPSEVSVWDAATGALLSHQPIVDPVTGAAFVTVNTPAVKGNRAYVVTSADGDSNQGRLYALDICESAACGGRGALTVAWHFDFDGPSQSSPLLVGKRLYFDGLKGQSTGLFFGVDDLGGAPSLAWSRRFTGRFGASAAHDPRGGLWVYPWQAGTLLRLNERTGRVDQTVAVGSVMGLSTAYAPVSAVSVTSTAEGAVALTFAAQTPDSNSGGIGPQVAAIDVSTTAAGSLLWKYKVSSNPLINAATGQFPVVTNANGARRVVVKGTLSSTTFLGEP